MFIYGMKNKVIPLLSRRFVDFLSTFSREFYLDNLFLRQILFNKKQKNAINKHIDQKARETYVSKTKNLILNYWS